MENKTPMQELIEWISENTNPETGNSRLNNWDIISKAKTLLEKERQVIIDAYEEGNTAMPNNNYSEDYYNETFNKNKDGKKIN